HAARLPHRQSAPAGGPNPAVSRAPPPRGALVNEESGASLRRSPRVRPGRRTPGLARLLCDPPSRSAAPGAGARGHGRALGTLLVPIGPAIRGNAARRAPPPGGQPSFHRQLRDQLASAGVFGLAALLRANQSSG